MPTWGGHFRRRIVYSFGTDKNVNIIQASGAKSPRIGLTRGREEDALISRKDVIQQLEKKRTMLNQNLMKTRSLSQANRIERELWALRAAIAYHQSQKTESESGALPKYAP